MWVCEKELLCAEISDSETHLPASYIHAELGRYRLLGLTSDTFGSGTPGGLPLPQQLATATAVWKNDMPSCGD